jgi:PAS domain S-box-containing protein
MAPIRSPHATTDVNHDLLDQLVDGAFALTDVRGKIVKWTEGAGALLGWLPAEVIGRSSFEAPLICDQPDLGSEWTAYLARETEQAPRSEVDVLALHRDGSAHPVSVTLIPVGLDLGLEVNFFLKALDLDLPRNTLVDYLRREHATVVETLIDCEQRGPEATAGQTIAGVLLLMRAIGDPTDAPDELRDIAAELRIEPVDERTSSAIIPGPPLPIEVPDAPTFTAPPPPGDALDSLVAAVRSDREQMQERLDAARADREQARERYEHAEQEVDSLRGRIDELERRSHEDAGLRARLEELENEHARSETRLEDLRGNLDTVTRRAGALEADLVRSAGESAELREALAAGAERAKRSETERLLAVERADALQATLEQVRAAAAEATRWLDGGLPARLDTVLQELSSTRDDAADVRARLATSVEGAPQEHPRLDPVAAPEPVAPAHAPEATAPVAARALIQPDGRFFELSPAFCELLSYPEAELKRAMWPPATDRTGASHLREITHRVLAGEVNGVRVETEYLDAHGAPVAIVGTLSLVDGADGRLVELALDPR